MVPLLGGNRGASRDNLTVTRMSFAGLKVVSFESRRAAEMAQLIRKQQGEPIVAPSMREAPIERNEEAFRFAERLFAGEFDMMILLTGVGTRILNQALATRYAPDRFAEALRRITVVPRGPKPVAVLREMKVPVTVTVPEPNTWREVLAATEGRPERRIAVQEYGRPSAELIASLRARGAEVTTVRVYQWDLPEDTGPLREAAERIAAEEVDVALFTTSVQIDHLLRVAAEKGLEDYVRAAFSKMVVASVGPATTEALEDNGIHPDFEPSHPKMGFLVQETADRAEALLKAKR
jgi:uroporphyrinogen-III synthase